jgi:hypothetical protein
VLADTNWMLRVTIKADALARDDQLFSATTAVGRASVPAATSSVPATRRFTLYSGSTGPNPEGQGTQSQQIVVPEEIEGYQIDSVQIAAAVLKRDRLRNALVPTGSPTAGLSPAPTAQNTVQTSPSATTSSSATGLPSAAVSVSATATAIGPPRLPPAPVRIISLDCDGSLIAINSLTGKPIENLQSVFGDTTPACLNLSVLPKPVDSTPTPS